MYEVFIIWFIDGAIQLMDSPNFLDKTKDTFSRYSWSSEEKILTVNFRSFDVDPPQVVASVLLYHQKLALGSIGHEENTRPPWHHHLLGSLLVQTFYVEVFQLKVISLHEEIVFRIIHFFLFLRW